MQIPTLEDEGFVRNLYQPLAVQGKTPKRIRNVHRGRAATCLVLSLERHTARTTITSPVNLAVDGTMLDAAAQRILREALLATGPVGEHLGDGGNKWGGGVFALGKVFCAPGQANRVLVFDPATDASRQIGPNLGAGERKWMNNGATGPDGCIYFAPCDARQVLCVNPGTGTV